MNKDSQRAMWTAELAILMTQNMTDGDRIKLYNLFYDRAYADGVVEGVDRGLNSVIHGAELV